MKKTIEVTFTPDGKFTVQTIGFKGSSCKQTTKAFEEALGQVESSRHTAEFFQSEATKNQQHLGQ